MVDFWSVPLSRPKICCALLYFQELQIMFFKDIEDYGRKCSVPGCTGNADTESLKEPKTVIFVYEKIPVQFDPQLHRSEEHTSELQSR